jgi:hypothetical protein
MAKPLESHKVSGQSNRASAQAIIYVLLIAASGGLLYAAGAQLGSPEQKLRNEAARAHLSTQSAEQLETPTVANAAHVGQHHAAPR